MSSAPLTRRHFLTLPVALLLASAMPARGDGVARRTPYEAEARVLFGTLRFRLAGHIDERVDRETGWYEVRMEGEGTAFANRGESSGVLRDGRWAPLRTASWVKVAGRESRSEIAYDYERRQVQYRSRSETFFLGRVRVVDDVVALPPGVHVDDTMSAFLNHADGYWRPGPGGTMETRVVRRQREPREAVEEATGTVKAEIIPVVLHVDGEQAGVVRSASLDISRFSTWALPDEPARIVFGPDGRPQQLSSKLMFGSSLTVRFLA